MLEERQELMLALVAIKDVKNILADNLRFPGKGFSAQGQSAPKARPKGVVDGQQVDIPVLNSGVM